VSEEERKAWARLVLIASIRSLEQCLGSPLSDEPDSAEEEAAAKAVLRAHGVDVDRYHAVACEEYGKVPLRMPGGRT
jgi:hypothetical protein